MASHKHRRRSLEVKKTKGKKYLAYPSTPRGTKPKEGAIRNFARAFRRRKVQSGVVKETPCTRKAQSSTCLDRDFAPKLSGSGIDGDPQEDMPRKKLFHRRTLTSISSSGIQTKTISTPAKRPEKKNQDPSQPKSPRMIPNMNRYQAMLQVPPRKVIGNGKIIRLRENLWRDWELHCTQMGLLQAYLESCKCKHQEEELFELMNDQQSTYDDAGEELAEAILSSDSEPNNSKATKKSWNLDEFVAHQKQYVADVHLFLVNSVEFSSGEMQNPFSMLEIITLVNAEMLVLVHQSVFDAFSLLAQNLAILKEFILHFRSFLVQAVGLAFPKCAANVFENEQKISTLSANFQLPLVNAMELPHFFARWLASSSAPKKGCEETAQMLQQFESIGDLARQHRFMSRSDLALYALQYRLSALQPEFFSAIDLVSGNRTLLKRGDLEAYGSNPTIVCRLYLFEDLLIVVTLADCGLRYLLRMFLPMEKCMAVERSADYEVVSIYSAQIAGTNVGFDLVRTDTNEKIELSCLDASVREEWLHALHCCTIKTQLTAEPPKGNT